MVPGARGRYPTEADRCYAAHPGAGNEIEAAMRHQPVEEEAVLFELAQHPELGERLAPALDSLARRLLEPQEAFALLPLFLLWPTGTHEQGVVRKYACGQQTRVERDSTISCTLMISLWPLGSRLYLRKKAISASISSRLYSSW